MAERGVNTLGPLPGGRLPNAVWKWGRNGTSGCESTGSVHARIVDLSAMRTRVDAAHERCTNLSQLQDGTLGSSEEIRIATTIVGAHSATLKAMAPCKLGPLLFWGNYYRRA